MTKRKPAYEWKAGDKARVIPGVEGEGTIFDVLGPAVYVYQWWVPIIDLESPDEPTFFKESGLAQEACNGNP